MPSPCPSDAELAAFVERRLPPEPSARIRDHLDDCDDCRQCALESAQAARSAGSTSGSGSAGARVESLADLGAGTRLGHFELGRLLGAGGMGVVYEAHDRRLERSVAIKLLPTGDRADDRLLTEARALAKIRHPSVLSVYEAGVFQEVVYIVMERIGGGTLRDFVARYRPPLPVRLALLLRAGQGLAAAHEGGLVHRDFKPDNVLLEYEPCAAGTPVVTRVLVADFGLAAAAESPAETPGARGAFAGTLGFAAPEQLDGQPVDARADVFSFAAAAWHTLYGLTPFAGQTLPEVRAAMRLPARLPERREKPAVPRRIELALRRALSPRPQDRPASVQALLAALSPPSRRALRLGLGAASLLALAGLAVFVQRKAARDEVSRCEARAASPWQPRRAAFRSRAAQGGVPGWVIDRVTTAMDAREAELAPLRARACAAKEPLVRRAFVHCRAGQAQIEQEALAVLHERWTRYNALEDVLDLPWPSLCETRAAQLELVLDPPGAAEQAALSAARQTLARIRLAQLVGKPASAWRTPLAALQQATLPAAVRERINGELLLTQARQLTRSEGQALPLVEQAVAYAERRGDLVGAARAWLTLAQLRLRTRKEPSAAEQASKQADWAIDRIGDPPSLRLEWLTIATSLAWQRSDVAGARALAHRALQLADQSPLQRRSVLRTMATVAAASADFQTQRRIIEQLLAEPGVAGSQDRSVQDLYVYYAECLYQLGEPEAAYRAVSRALALLDQTRNTSTALTVISEDTLRAYALLARSFAELDLDRPDDCLASIAEAEALLARIAPDDLLVGNALNIRASALAHKGEYRAALSVSECASRFFTERLGRSAEETIAANKSIGELVKQLGQLGRAREILAAALQDARATFGDRDPRVAYTESDLADTLVELHRPAEAIPLYEHGRAVLAEAGDTSAYAAQLDAGLARLIVREQPARAQELAEHALSAWRDRPYWKTEHAELTAWLKQQRFQARPGTPAPQTAQSPRDPSGR